VGERRHELSVGIRICPARTMVEVGSVEPQAVFFAQSKQDVKQAKRIRPTGDTDDDDVPRSQ